jgi:hypothetical protein
LVVAQAEHGVLQVEALQVDLGVALLITEHREPEPLGRVFPEAKDLTQVLKLVEEVEAQLLLVQPLQQTAVTAALDLHQQFPELL